MKIEYINTIAKEAGALIMEVYSDANFEKSIELKGDDSPLTKADTVANAHIVKELKRLYPEIPIISEEEKNLPFEVRKNWSKCWVVDPLDGTKEFIKRNGEFTVNIALVEKNKPILGVIYVPVLDKLYFGEKGKGSFVQEANQEPTPIQCNSFQESDEGLRFVCSRSHRTPEVDEYLSKFKNPETLSMGSSLKFMLVAEGKADIYPRLAPTMEWDTCAAQAILEEAGGKVIDQATQNNMVYNKENLLNNFFIAYGSNS